MIDKPINTIVGGIDCVPIACFKKENTIAYLMKLVIHVNMNGKNEKHAITINS